MIVSDSDAYYKTGDGEQSERWSAGYAPVICRSSHALPSMADQWSQVHSKSQTTWFRSNQTVFVAEMREDDRQKPHVVVFQKEHFPIALLVATESQEKNVHRFGYLRLRSCATRQLQIRPGGAEAVPGEGGAVQLVDYVRDLLRSRKVDYACFNMIRADSNLCRMLMSERGSVVERRSVHWMCRLRNPKSGMTEKVCSAKTRSTLRRKDRRLRAKFHGVRCECIRSTQDVARFAATAARINSQSYHAALGVGFTGDDVSTAVAVACANAGMLRSYVLHADGMPVSYILGIVVGNVFVLEATGFLFECREHSPGSVLLWNVVQELTADGVDAIDFGIGDAEYKQIYGNEYWSEVSVGWYGPALRARIARLQGQIVAAGDAWGRRVVEIVGATRALRRVWRRRLATKGQRVAGTMH